MTREGRPHDVQTAPMETTISHGDLNRTARTAALPSSRTATVAQQRLAAAWAEHAKMGQLVAQLAEHRANGGTR